MAKAAACAGALVAASKVAHWPRQLAFGMLGMVAMMCSRPITPGSITPGFMVPSMRRVPAAQVGHIGPMWAHMREPTLRAMRANRSTFGVLPR